MGCLESKDLNYSSNLNKLCNLNSEKIIILMGSTWLHKLFFLNYKQRETCVAGISVDRMNKCDDPRKNTHVTN